MPWEKKARTGSGLVKEIRDTLRLLPADSGISSRVFCSGSTLLVCMRARACPRWWDGNGGWFRGCYGEGVVVGGA
jgi:hypothetical protein